MYIDNLENLIPLDELSTFIKNLLKHFPKYRYFFETRGSHIESLTKELIRSKKIKKSDIRIYHFIKNKKTQTSHVSQHTVTKRNEVFPSLYNTNRIEENWKRKIPLQLHFN
jgi:CRISPR/Cas system-associated endoribonuclease Cas2